MVTFRRNPVFYSVLCLLVAACFGGLWYLSQLRGRVEALKRSYDTKSSQYARYVAAKPSPTKTNLKALESNYAELYQAFEQTMAALNLSTYDRATFFGVAPDSRAAWSYELNKYIAGARYQAVSNGIQLAQNPGFGFSDPNFVPVKDEAERVHRQVVIMTALLQTLFDSGIESFVSIQRGVRPESARGGKPASGRGQRAINEAEEFPVTPAMTAAVPGVIDAYAFRVAFRGQSIALRSFVNRIVNSNLPYAIRGIEVDLSSESGAKTELESLAVNPFASDDASRRSATAANVPIISENTSTFVVTLEFLDLAVDVPPPAAATSEKEGAPDA